MRRRLRKLIQILDGTPVVHGQRQSGQSIVEMALITPILIVLFAGLVEIGWFANNYLSLLDVTRAGARRAATLQDTLSPLSWNNLRSYVPTTFFEQTRGNQTPNTGFAMPQGGDNGDNNQRIRSLEQCSSRLGFYYDIICVMLTTMDPLYINEQNGIDDIVISAFSVEQIDPARNNTTDGGPAWLPPGRPARPQMVVVGRYPTNANECDVMTDGNRVTVGNPISPLQSLESRDPFDINDNNLWDVDRADVFPLGSAVITNPDMQELEGFDLIAADYLEAEKQRGYVWTGQHRLPGTLCIGSEWTIERVEALMNAPGFVSQTNNAELFLLPGQGVVIVEMFWEHRMLLQLPIFIPFLDTVSGSPTGNPVIEVWAAFPLPSVEPYFDFDCPPASPGATRPIGCEG